jgi:phospholipase C
MRHWLPFALLPTLVAFAVSPAPAAPGVRVLQRAPVQPARLPGRHKRIGSNPLQHIVVIIQENRTLDNLFNGFCVNATVCANTVTVDPVSGTPLVPESLAAPFDPVHSHGQFVKQFDYGKMDGFSKSSVGCGKHTKCPYTVFDYVPQSETVIYQQLATVDGELSDATFETSEGPSLPAHMYAIGGQSGGFDSDHYAIESGSGNCGSNTVKGHQINMTTPFPGKNGPTVQTCKDFQTIFDLVANAGLTWKYYAPSKTGFKAPTQNIQHLYNSPNFIYPNTQYFTDVAAGNLADVTFLAPTAAASDHPGLVKNPEAGPNFVAQAVNAIGETPYWSNTAVVVWWDDWGGLYDHVAPTPPQGLPQWYGEPDPFEYCFRVPLIVASAYANVGSIDHTNRTFVSAIRLIEETFGLPELGTMDQFEPDGLDPMFNFNNPPIPYTILGGSDAQPFRKSHTVDRSVYPDEE